MTDTRRDAREMADIITEPITSRDVPQLAHIELMFFAYRDFTADSDRILAGLGFGRAHHRALYFINRNPGLSVAELISILGITKQSLSRVLRQLIAAGNIRQLEGCADRRQRLLYPTAAGRALILELSRPQSRRIERALRTGPTADEAAVTGFMRAMIDPGRRSGQAAAPHDGAGDERETE